MASISHNLKPSELKKLGANKVIMVDKAFDTEQHFPMKITKEEVKVFGADVGFIGSYAPERKDILEFLALNGINVRVWGNGWEDQHADLPNLKLEKRPLVNKPQSLDYTKAIIATKINIGFLRKVNRDLQTDRSVEIPACGGFLLAERSVEHERLFNEGKEAVYFDTKKELLKKIKYLLKV